MKNLRIVDGQTTYNVILVPDESSLTVHSVWRFFPGRALGEKITTSSLPWFARQQIAEMVGDPLP